MTKRILAIIAVLSLLCIAFLTLPACEFFSGQDTNNLNTDDSIREIYTAYAENGGKLSYEAWLASIKGADGVGIVKIEKTSTEGLVDTYTITLTNGTASTFTVTNGKNGIATIEINDDGFLVINGIATTAKQKQSDLEDNQDDNPEDTPRDALNTHPTRPAVETTISAELQAKLDHALTNGATDAEKAEAAMELYALANVNKKNAAQCVMIAQGFGKVVVGGAAEGEMTVRAFKVQDNGVYYYQKGAKLTKVNMGTTDLLSQVLDKQERTYAPADDKYRAVMMSGTSARVGNGETDVTKVFSSELPFIDLGVADRKGNVYDEYGVTITNKEEFLEKAFVYGGDPKEINNFNYHKEAIHDVEISIFEDNGQKYYDINFVVDCTDEETVKVARQYLRTSSSSENLEFSSLRVNLKIWDNGYIRSFKDWEKWAGDASVKVGAFSSSGSSSSVTDYEGVFYWDYDSLVADGILNAEDPDIKKATYTADIIKKYASQPGWVSAE